MPACIDLRFPLLKFESLQLIHGTVYMSNDYRIFL
uniref:Uncharacterized protein n=1 Tax=Setaria italica TaxID=4555 RepID=K3ZGF6_SETIT